MSQSNATAKYYRAVLDLGSNSVRLLIPQEDGEQEIQLRRNMRLAEGVDATGCLSEAAMQRTLQAVQEMIASQPGLMPQQVAAFATSAVRDANNRDEFVARAAAQGLEVRVLTGDEEAYLAFLGAAGGRDACVFDIGGGSTEVVAGKKGVVHFARSLQMGAVRLAERCPHHAPLQPGEDVLLQRTAAQEFEGLDDALCLAAGAPPRFIAVGGTVQALSAIELGGKDVDKVHGHRLDKADIRAIFKKLAAMTVEQRMQAMPTLSPGRADVIVSGTALLLSLMRELGTGAVEVSMRDTLHGYWMWLQSGEKEFPAVK